MTRVEESRKVQELKEMANLAGTAEPEINAGIMVVIMTKVTIPGKTRTKKGKAETITTAAGTTIGTMIGQTIKAMIITPIMTIVKTGAIGNIDKLGMTLRAIPTVTKTITKIRAKTSK